MNCRNCQHYGFREMIKTPYGYSGEIPCLTCVHYTHLEDNFVAKTTAEAMLKTKIELFQTSARSVSENGGNLITLTIVHVRGKQEKSNPSSLTEKRKNEVNSWRLFGEDERDSR